MPAPRRKRENEKNERPLPKRSKTRNEPEEKRVPLKKLLLSHLMEKMMETGKDHCSFGKEYYQQQIA